MSKTVRNRFITVPHDALHSTWVRQRETRDKPNKFNRLCKVKNGKRDESFVTSGNFPKSKVQRAERRWMKTRTRERIADYLDEQREELMMLIEQEQQDEWEQCWAYEDDDLREDDQLPIDDVDIVDDGFFYDPFDDCDHPATSLHDLMCDPTLTLAEHISRRRMEELYFLLENAY